jgi:eukaryotic-like serine/threonine-protein kinase
MLFTPGTRLGLYEIQGHIGSGGMGDVYRARDTRLGRSVAIKVLAGPLATDPQWLARFEQEARLLASFNHPNIAQIYGFDGDGPHTRALVMELVEGHSLADRLANGPLLLQEALLIALQIAEALEAAHERGIIHRDLKPGNVLLTPGWGVKVLDFGLAKLIEPAAPAELGPARLNSPAITSPVTVSGVILGTAAYMAPEQARGQAVDKRTDLWAFGVVLYEMITGRRPFDGETVSDTIAAVLRQDVDWKRLPAQTPDEVRRLLKRCLERNPKNRLHDAADARLAIIDAREDSATGAATRGVAAAPRALPWIVASLVATAIAGAIVVRDLRSTPAAADLPRSVVRFTAEPPAEATNVSYLAAAPDGRFMVYQGQVDGDARLFVRRFDELESHLLTGSEGGRGPFVSPDGAWVGFVRNGKIYKVPTGGGDAIAVCSVQGGAGASWGPGGQIVYSRAWLSGLSAVSADGGAPTVLTEPDPGKREIGHWWPSTLPDGRVLFTIAAAGLGLNDAHIGLLDPATRSYRTLFAGAKADWLPSGHVVFFRAGRYHVVPFDLSSGAVTGEPFPVLDDAREIDPAGDWSQTVAVTSTGTVAYLSGPYVPNSRLTWIGADGVATPLPFPPRPYIGVKLAPDGRRAATASLEAGHLLLRVLDLERGTEEAPKLDGMNWNPAWLPDGRLSYTSMRKGDFDVYVKDVVGAGPEQPVLTGPDDTDPIAWTRDGHLVLQGSEPDGSYPLKLFDPRDPSRTTRLTEQHVENGGSVSPDDRWLVYQTATTGRSIIYVRPLAANVPAVALSPDPGEFPVFLRDGRTLALVRGRQLVVRPWRENAGRFDVGPERVVTQLDFGSGWTYTSPYDVADGGRFLALVRVAETPPSRIRVVVGWTHELARLISRERP